MPNRRAERSEPILPARVDRFHQSCGVLNLPASGIPRMSTPRDEPWGMREFTVVDRPAICSGSATTCATPTYQLDREFFVQHPAMGLHFEHAPCADDARRRLGSAARNQC